MSMGALWIIGVIVGVLVIYALYALIASTVFARRRRINKCSGCPHNRVCDPTNPNRVCDWGRATPSDEKNEK